MVVGRTFVVLQLKSKKGVKMSTPKKEGSGIDKENWQSSYDKWIEIIEKTKVRETFLNQDGFRDLEVVRECGYCEYDSEKGDNSCSECLLFSQELCSMSGNIYPEYTFWKYVVTMKKGEKVDFAKASLYAKKILSAIKEDGRNMGYIE